MNLHQLRRCLRSSLHQQQKPMVAVVKVVEVAAAAVTKFAKCVARSITTMTFSNISLSFQKTSDTNAIIALSLFPYSCLFAAHIRACSNAYSSNPNNKKPNSTNNYPTTSVSTVTTAGNDVKNIVSPSVTTSNTSSNIYTKSDKIASTMDTNGYRCEVCSRIFTNRVVLTNHIERMHGGKGPTECEFCRKKYSSVVDLIMHKKSHVGMATYQCQYCDQHFMNRSMVTEHERIHTGDTPYRCEFCNRGFSYRSNLIVHKRIHDSKRNHFECDQCGQTFQHGAQLTRHKLVHTTDKPLDCRYCGKRFVIYNKLIAHIKEEHPNKS